MAQDLASREHALALLGTHVKNQNMFRHCLASEAVMRALARRFGEDENKWGLAGLLHDLDVEITGGDMSLHGSRARQMLVEAGYPDDMAESVAMHNEKSSGRKRAERFHKALAAGETITGLITATTLVYPDRKLASVKVSSIVKRMKEKAFAASVDRDIIRECEDIGIPLQDFAALALDAMRGISGELGL